jgi:hypothetical protein
MPRYGSRGILSLIAESGESVGHWDARPAAKENLRLFEAPNTWRRYADDVDPVSRAITTSGSSSAVERFLMNGLNATNVLLLTGAGSSFCVENSGSSKLAGVAAPSLADLLSAVKDKVGTTRFNQVTGIIPNGAKIGDIEKLLTHAKLYVALYGEAAGDGKVVADFIADAEAAILARVDFVDEATDVGTHEIVLRKIARRGARKPRAKIFTTNYDLSFEYAARRSRFVVVDGFSHAVPQVYDRSHFALDIVRRDASDNAPDYLESVFQLYKLHGSIDWRRTPAEIMRARGNDGKPVLIYPRDSKYQEAFEPPYLDMMGAFQTALREPDTMLVSAGFSFSDSHLAQPVVAALESNMSFRMVVCDPAFLPDNVVSSDPVTVTDPSTKPSNPFHARLMSLAQVGDQRLMLLHGRYEDLALALPDLVAETERERHAMRIKALRDADSGRGGAPAR